MKFTKNDPYIYIDFFNTVNIYIGDFRFAYFFIFSSGIFSINVYVFQKIRGIVGFFSKKPNSIGKILYQMRGHSLARCTKQHFPWDFRGIISG